MSKKNRRKGLTLDRACAIIMLVLGMAFLFTVALAPSLERLHNEAGSKY